MALNHAEQDLVLITGSSGLIGTAVQKALSKHYRVVGLDIYEPREPVAGATWLHCDLTDDDSVKEVLTKVRQDFGSRIASVVHLAAYVDFSGEPSPMYNKLTVEGSRRLVQALKDLEVEQFVFSSSLLVMKPVEHTNERLTETSPTRGEWAYPQSKIDAENVLRHEHGDIPLVILRIAGVYDDDLHSLPIGQQIRRIHDRQLESFVFPGRASHGQPFIHLEDLAECVRCVIKRRKELESEETFLIGEPDAMSYGALQNRIGELLHGKEWPTIRIPKPAAKAGAWIKEKLPGVDPFIKPWMIDLADDHYPIQIRRARERLGWAPKHSLDQELDRIIADLKSDPRGWYEKNNLPPPRRVEEMEPAHR